jgi:arylsulfatase A-like enzyme
MGNVSASLGYGTGFDTYQDLYKSDEIVDRRQTRDASSEELDHESVDEVAIPRASDINNRMIDWLDSVDTQFFAFGWSVEPHIPYDPPSGYCQYTDDTYDGPVDGQRETLPEVDTQQDLEQLKALYDGEIRYNDQQLGALIEALRERDLYDETLIIVMGDHGDAFRDHGQLTHGNLPYDEVLRVPLVVKPTTEMGINGEVIREICSLIDIAPTVLDATDVDWHNDIQGRSLYPWGPSGCSKPVFSETRSRDIYPAYYSVRTEDWKYMYVDSPDRDVGTVAATVKQIFDQGMMWEILRHPFYYFDRYQNSENRYLFDLTANPDETENLVESHPAQADEFHKRIQSWLNAGEKLGEQFDEKDRDIDAATSEQLRRLGYID